MCTGLKHEGFDYAVKDDAVVVAVPGMRAEVLDLYVYDICICIYIYMCVCVCVCVCISTHTHAHNIFELYVCVYTYIICAIHIHIQTHIPDAYFVAAVAGKRAACLYCFFL